MRFDNFFSVLSSVLWKSYKLLVAGAVVFAGATGERTIGIYRDPREENFGRMLIKGGKDAFNPTYKVCFQGWDYENSKDNPVKDIAYEVQSDSRRALAYDMSTFQKEGQCDYDRQQQRMSFTQAQQCLEKVSKKTHAVTKKYEFIKECREEFRKQDEEQLNSNDQSSQKRNHYEL